jgi:leucine-zipper of insertion element IS481
MGHANARLTFYGRCELVRRVRAGRPVAHVAKEMGVSRQCGPRWVARFAAEGWDGLRDRSSRPHHSRRGPALMRSGGSLRPGKRPAGVLLRLPGLPGCLSGR